MLENRKPKYQAVIESIYYIFVVVVLFFSFADGLSSSIDFINLPIAIWGTVVIIILFLFLFYFPKFKWKTSEGTIITVTKFQKTPYLFLAACVIGLWIPIGINNINQKKTTNLNLTKIEFNPIFQDNDTTSFNVLILDFEDFRKKQTNCIGRSIQENLNNISANSDLSLFLNNQYVDSIKNPRSRKDAEKIQKNHNADLIIYGLAKDVTNDCTGAELVFRYNISDNVISKLGSVISARSYKHDSNYGYANTLEIEQDSLKINSITLKKWVKALVNVKAENPNMAFLELDEILKNSENYIQLKSDTLKGDKYIVIAEKKNKSNRFIAIGQTYFDLMQYEKALIVYDSAISLFPYEKAFYQNRGAIYSELGEYNRSLKDFDKYISLSPTEAHGYYNKGNTNRLIKQYLEAINNFNQAILLNPNDIAFYEYRGIAFNAIGEYNNAIDDFNTIISLNPNFSGAYDGRGSSYYSLRQYERSIEDFKKAIELNPNSTSAINNLGATYGYLKKFVEAIRIFDKSIALDSTYASSYYNRAIVYSELTKYRKAIEDYNKAIAFEPSDSYAYNNRGYCLLKLNKPSEAILDINKSLSLDKNNSWAYRNLACYNILKSQNDLALKNLEKAISLGYDDFNWMNTEEILNPIRLKPEFQNLLKLVSESKLSSNRG